RARLLIEHAETLGEPPEDPLLLFLALSALFSANVVAFNGEVAREHAEQMLALAEKQGGKVPLILGHRAMNSVSMQTGSFAEAVCSGRWVACALRSGRKSTTDKADRPRSPHCSINVSVAGGVGAWLP